VYIGDLLSPVCRSAGELWDRTRKVPAFRAERLLTELPMIPPGSLSAAFCWQLLDVLPREALPEVIGRLFVYLAPGGVLFLILREPHLKKGADTAWHIETPTKVGTRSPGQKPYPYPPLSNRDLQRLVPASNTKTVLTRSGVREVLVIK
jgi:hypothetical protein